MSNYNPDRWVMLKITRDGQVTYKVLGSWYGGYTGSDSWKLNSGVTAVEVDGDSLLFSGASGSVYRCHKNSYGMSSYASDIYAGFVKHVEGAGPDYSMELCPKDTDFSTIDY